MIDRQERNVRRDGTLFLLGVAGIVLVEVVVPSDGVRSVWVAVHGFLLGCSLGIMISGIFRVRSKQALYSTLALGVGLMLGSVIDIF